MKCRRCDESPRAASFFAACISAQACFYQPTGAPSGSSTGATSTASTDAASAGVTGETSTPTSAAHTSSSGAPILSSTGGTGTSTTGEPSTTATGEAPPDEATLELSFSQVKRFDFSWSAAVGADYYQLLESSDGEAEYEQIGGDIVGETISVAMPLHFRINASYKLRACNGAGCTDSGAVDVVDSLATAVGYFKADNAEAADRFGCSVALSSDGNTLAVGAFAEASAATGIAGDQTDNTADFSGAVYVFVRANDVWSQQAYVKASNTEENDFFGIAVALSGDGDTLAVGAFAEGSAATGIDGDQTSNGALSSGAVYVFVRANDEWAQQAYVKASNTGFLDEFGASLALSGDGGTLVVGAPREASAAVGIDSGQNDNTAPAAGAVYVFVRESNVWSQQAYIKASNTGAGDQFGCKVAVSADGSTLAVSAWNEDSAATGIGGDQADDTAVESGAVYIFVRSDSAWSQPAYIKASNTEQSDRFGSIVALSGDGKTLAVGADGESSAVTGIGGDQADNGAAKAGAVYVFVYTNNNWSQQAYVKASNAESHDQFGVSAALSADGGTLAVGAWSEDSASTGITGPQVDNGTFTSGAVYMFVRANGDWAQAAYVKASNTGDGDQFGLHLAISGDSTVLAVGADSEDSAAVGIGGTQDMQADDAAARSGAVYLY